MQQAQVQVERAETKARFAAAPDVKIDFGSPPVPGTGTVPSKKTPEAIKTLKDSLAKFEVYIYTFPGPGGGPDADKTSVRLVTDQKKAVANPRQVFSISEKQALALIDYLAENGLFERVSVDPPGLPNIGWYVDVRGGESSTRIGHWHYSPDVKPASVRVIQLLMQILDGDAKAALERFRSDGGKPK
jgi:hypothetical protein